MKETAETTAASDSKRSLRNLGLLSGCRTASGLATQIFLFCQGLYVLEITGSAADFTAVLIAGVLPRGFLNFFAGILVDRLPRKPLIVGADLFAGLLVFSYWHWFLKDPENLFLFTSMAFLLTSINVIYTLSVQAATPEMVDKRNVGRVNAMNQGIGAVVRVVSPLIGAILYSKWGMSAAFVANGISFLISATLELRIHFPLRDAGNKHSFSAFQNLEEVLLFLKGQPVARKMLAIFILLQWIYEPMVVLLLPYVVYKVIGVSEFQFSWIQMASSVGALLAAAALTAKRDALREIRFFFPLQLGQGMLFCLWALAAWHFIAQDTWRVTLLFICTQFFGRLMNLWQTAPIFSYFQVALPPHLRGKTLGLASSLAYLTIPVVLWLVARLLDQFAWYQISFVFGSLVVAIGLIFMRDKELSAFLRVSGGIVEIKTATAESSSPSRMGQVQPSAALFKEQQKSWIPMLLFLAVAAWALLFTDYQRENLSAKNVSKASLAQVRAHLVQIASVPHPIGSPAHGVVHDYLKAQLQSFGLEVTEQDSFSLHESKQAQQVANVRNLVARLRGKGHPGALTLLAHYDSAQNAPGASDDGAAVASLLEAARLLAAGPVLERDLLFVFTDGEEAGLFGANLLASDSEFIAETAVMLNFEARGNNGPSLLFETGNTNGRLIHFFAQNANCPQGSSLGEELYKHMPNSTDFSAFRPHGIPTLNFAILGNPAYYHTGADRSEWLSEAALAHQLAYILSLAPAIANHKGQLAGGSNPVYFNAVGQFFTYNRNYIPFINLALTGIVFVLLSQAKKAGHLSKNRMLLSFFSFPITAAFTGFFLTIVSQILSGMDPDFYNMLFGHSYATNHYFFALSLLAVALALFIVPSLLKRLGSANASAGVILGWLFLIWICGFWTPGVHFLLWPPILAALAALLPTSKGRSPTLHAFFCLLLALPLLLVALPYCYPLFLSLPFSLVGFVSFILVSFLISATGVFALMPVFAAHRCSCILFFFGLLGLFYAKHSASFGERQPQPTSLFYASDGTKGHAFWASERTRPLDEFTEPLLTAQPTKQSLSFLPFPKKVFRTHPAPKTGIEMPEVCVLEDVKHGPVREISLSFKLSPSAQALVIRKIGAGEGQQLRLGSIVLTPPTPEKPLFIYGYQPEQELHIRGKSQTAFKLEISELREGMPQFQGAPSIQLSKSWCFMASRQPFVNVTWLSVDVFL